MDNSIKISYTDRDDHTLGIFTTTGSDTPASSLARATSSYVSATAIIRLSSSDKATHESGFADRNASTLASVFMTHLCSHQLDAIAYSEVSVWSTNFGAFYC